MADFTVRLTAPVPAEEGWRRIWDLDAHTRVIPLTHLTRDDAHAHPLRSGSRFVARTGVGPVGVDDVMEVTQFDAPTSEHPGTARVIKTGKVVHGHINATLHNTPGGCELLWRQSIRISGVPRLADPVLTRIAKGAYTRVLTTLLTTPPQGSPTQS